MQAFPAGELLPGDLVQLEPFLTNRNFFRVMLPYLADSGRLKAFLQDNCADAVVRYPNTTIYRDYLPRPPPDPLTVQDAMLVCTDARRDALGDWLRCVLRCAAVARDLAPCCAVWCECALIVACAACR